jgi:type IV secretion system protein VirB10
MGSLGQQMMGNGMNRPATIEIRPGYEFNVMLTEDLVFPGPYGAGNAANVSAER